MADDIGDSVATNFHIIGFQRMVKLRGGLDAFGHNTRSQKKARLVGVLSLDAWHLSTASTLTSGYSLYLDVHGFSEAKSVLGSDL